MATLDTAWCPKVDLGVHFGGKRGRGGRRILRPRVGQETTIVENRDEKTPQRGARDIPKEGQIVKIRKLQHLDFERPYEGLATFTPFGETGGGKKSC